MNILKILLPFLFLLACTRTSEPELNLLRNDDVAVSDVFSRITVVALESGPESMISGISKVMYHDGYYYIFDRDSYAILCFDQQGTFSFKINSRGRGKGEYGYISDFTIDRKNNQILLLDPIVQKVFRFDQNGVFLDAIDLQADQNLGLGQILILDDEVLMFTGRQNAFEFFSLKENSFFHAEFPFNSSLLFSLYSRRHVYQFAGSTFALPPLGQEIMDLTDYYPKPYFELDFGKYNNHEKQIEGLVRQTEEWYQNIYSGSQVTGKGKHLHHYVMMVNETPRFRLSLIEFDNAFKNIVIDKKLDKTWIFDSFREGTLLPWSNIQVDRSISLPVYPISKRDSLLIVADGLEDYYFRRNHKTFCRELLSEEDKVIVDSHNSLHDNPFLVVYIFRE